MKKVKLAALATAVVSTLGLTGCHDVDSNQRLVNDISNQLQLRYFVVDNHANTHGIKCAELGADWAACNRATIALHNNGNQITDTDWAIYFHSIRQILGVETDQFKITHITGDLHKLQPTDHFKGFPANRTIEIPIIGEYWQVAESDVMPRWYVTSGDAKPKILSNTNTEALKAFVAPISGEQWKRTPDDKNILMTPVSRFDKNSDIKTWPTEQLRGQILPTPTEVTLKEGDVSLENGLALSLPDGFPEPATELIESRFSDVGVSLDSSGYPLRVDIDPSAIESNMAGAYLLDIGPEGAKIVANDETGAFYGVQSILSMLPAGKDNPSLAMLSAKDAPRFEYRAMFIDIGRNFKTKSAIMGVLDQMASYKLNKLHLHMTDDEGWRIEIPGLPELTDIGSQRCHDLTEQKCLLPQLGSGPDTNNNGSGYLSRKDYIEIIEYAKDRFIEVIPEIDMPAHARAAVVAMEARYQRLHEAGKEKEANEYRLVDPTDTSNTTSVQFYDKRSYLNPCLASSQTFVDKVIGEIAKMHVEAGQPIQTWHFGGDEAKNIRLGAGYQDIKTKDKVDGKGLIDQSKENRPWEKSQVCQQMVTSGKVADIEHLPSYFAVEVSKIIKKHNIPVMQAWQDGLKHAKNAKAFATDKVRVNFWDTLYWGGFSSVNEWAQKGYDVIISNPDYVYFDMPYEVNPAERGYYWATRFSDERKVFSFAPNNLPQNAETSYDRDGNIFSAKADTPWPGTYGMSAQVWTETVRTDEQLAYMAFPRLLAFAERAWHQAGWELPYQAGREYKMGSTQFVDQAALLADWTRFANIIGQRELQKLDQAGMAYRLPVPGAKIVDGQLLANVVFPGLDIEYSLDHGRSWLTFTEPVAIDKDKSVMIRSRSSDGKRFSREEIVE